jgi:DNA-binding response OmpR family regulator
MDSLKPVLHVDDHGPARLARTLILQRAGFRVDEVDNAAEAVQTAPEASLLLFNLRFSDADGFSICAQVKNVAPALPVLIVTAVCRTAQARRAALAVGADAFLLEPITAGHLVRTVESLINPKAGTRRALTEGWVRTDAIGDVLDLSDQAAKLLNLSARGARGRHLPAFFTDNRAQLISDLLRASDGLIIDRASTLQPRDRRPVRVHIDVSALPHVPGERLELHWVLWPEPA